MLQAFVAEAKTDFARLTMGLFASSFNGSPVQFADVSGDPTSVNVIGPQSTVALTFDPQTHLPRTFGDVTYSDYRSVNGVKVPFRLLMIRRDRDGSYSEEWDIRHFHVNAVIAPKMFEPRGELVQ